MAKKAKPSLQERIAADRQRRAAIERARMDEILSEFPALDDLARETMRLHYNEAKLWVFSNTTFASGC